LTNMIMINVNLQIFPIFSIQLHVDFFALIVHEQYKGIFIKFPILLKAGLRFQNRISDLISNRKFRLFT